MNIFSLVGSVAPEVTVKILDTKGVDTGEYFKLHNPSSGLMVKAFTAYISAGQKIRRENKELLLAGEKSGDFSEYNEIARPQLEELDLSFAITCVSGWSMTDECNESSIESLMKQLPYLAVSVISAFFEAKEESEKK